MGREITLNALNQASLGALLVEFMPDSKSLKQGVCEAPFPHHLLIASSRSLNNTPNGFCVFRTCNHLTRTLATS